jgi:hypothetical protein
LLFKNEGKTKTFSDKQNLAEFIIHISSSQGMLKRSLKEKWKKKKKKFYRKK